MAEKKGFFSFFRGTSDKQSVISEEERLQKEHAERLNQLEQQAKVYTPTPRLVVAESEPTGSVSDEVRDFCVNRLREILHDMGFKGADVVVERISGDQLYLEILDEAEIGRIIGREGSTLDAFQILIRAIVFRKYDIGAKVFVDAGQYRSRRNDNVKEMALKAFESGRRRVVLRPMTASERRVVHTLFQEDKTIKTYSIGRGEERHVVLERLKTVEA